MARPIRANPIAVFRTDAGKSPPPTSYSPRLGYKLTQNQPRQPRKTPTCTK
nr:MAG TPA: hypothetical protein [Caudoviricetes sp.]